MIPSVIGFLCLGDVIAGILFQTGEFNQDTSIYVWRVLGGSAVGLLASTLGRLYSSAFYSLRDTKTPLRFSIVRVVLTTVLGYLMGLKLPQMLGLDASWGTAGLTASAGMAGWVEFMLLRSKINHEIGKTGIPISLTFRLWIAALFSGAAGFGTKLYLPPGHPILNGMIILGVFGVCYFGLCALFQVEESSQVIKRILKRLRIIKG
ncbi:MviN-like protein [compost metagenome]